MSAAYVRSRYGVDYKQGERLAVDGRQGVLVSFPGAYFGVRFEGERRTSHCHPTWRVERVAHEFAEAVGSAAEPDDPHNRPIRSAGDTAMLRPVRTVGQPCVHPGGRQRRVGVLQRPSMQPPPLERPEGAMMSTAIYLTAVPRMTATLEILSSVELHCTLCYFPDGLYNADARRALQDFFHEAVRSGPFTAQVDGLAFFHTPEGNKKVLLVRSQRLDDLRLGARQWMQRYGLVDGEGLGLGAAHMTLGPARSDLMMPGSEVLPTQVSFEHLRLHEGNGFRELPFAVSGSPAIVKG